MIRKVKIVFGCAAFAVTLIVVSVFLLPDSEVTIANRTEAQFLKSTSEVNSKSKVATRTDGTGGPLLDPHSKVPLVSLKARPADPEKIVKENRARIVALGTLTRQVVVTNSSDLRRMLFVAQSVNEIVFANFVREKLRTSDLSLAERNNVIWLATKNNSPVLLPVWQGLLNRTLPAFPEETADWSGWMLDHRNEQLHLMQTEQLRALNGIGVLQGSSEEAKDFLMVFATGQIPVPGDLTLLRTEATRQIHQYSGSGLLRVASLLTGTDPLREQLSVIARVKRGEYETP